MKRQYPDSNEVYGSNAKRQKSRDEVGVADPVIHSIRSVEDIRNLLLFHQNEASTAVANIRVFESFIKSVTIDHDREDAARSSNILLEWLKTELAVEAPETTDPSLAMIQTWRFASQIKDAKLMRVVAEAFAALIKSISHKLEFEELGLRLCKVLLHTQQLKLIEHGLSLNITKSKTIISCLDLLTQIIAFGGGACAREIYAQRDITLRRLDVYLSNSTASNKDRRLPLRLYALRYVIANFRYQSKVAKTGILMQHGMARALFHDIDLDPADIVTELFLAMTRDIVKDNDLPRSVKGRFFNDSTLGTILNLASTRRKHLREEDIHLADAAYAFLSLVCTSRQSGVPVQHAGWYPSQQPAEVGVDQVITGEELISRLMSRTQYSNKVPVRNTTLASFLQRLRPHANEYEHSLALAIFETAPELIADYFLRKKHFTLEPKLSATWIGYSAFVLATIQLPFDDSHLPVSHESQGLPPIPVILESVMPQPMSKRALTKSINHRTPIIEFTALRLLKASYLKLGRIISFIEVQRPQWADSLRSLINAFSQRCPEMSHIVAAMKSCPAEQHMLRETIGSVLGLYYKYTPQLAARESLDVSIDLIKLLQSEQPTPSDSNPPVIRRLELVHLLRIACLSSTVRWWHKPENMPLSPFASLLRLYAHTPWADIDDLGNLIQNLLHEHSVLQNCTEQPPLKALMSSLKARESWEPCDALWTYVDECLQRLVRRPIKYQGDLDHLLHYETKQLMHAHEAPLSLLLIVLVEQWPFFVARRDSSELANIAIWLGNVLVHLETIGEDSSLIDLLRRSMQESASDSTISKLLQKPDRLDTRCGSIGESEHDLQTDDPGLHNPILVQSAPSSEAESGYDSCKPPAETTSHPGLHRWLKEDLFDAIENGHVGDLIMCLCSQFTEIRQQAFTNLRLLLSKIDKDRADVDTIGSSAKPSNGSYGYRQQLYVLIGGLCETVNGIVAVGPVPSFAASLASRGVLVLNNPLHPMYAKFNKFLLRRPLWDLNRLPSYWLDSVILQPPTIDKCLVDEIEWVYDTLFHGLLTSDDMDMYRRCGVIERILVVSALQSLPKRFERTVLRLIHRAASVKGSRTMVTRNGVLYWLEHGRNQNESEHRLFKQATIKRIEEASRDEVGGGWLTIQ